MKPVESAESEARITARTDGDTKARIAAVAKQLGVSESDILRMGINIFLPQFESGKIDPRKFLKKAA